MKKNKVVVNGVEILFYKKDQVEFISLTDIAKSNMEVLNASLLVEKVGKEERFIQLQATAIHQFSILAHTPSVKKLEEKK